MTIVLGSAAVIGGGQVALLAAIALKRTSPATCVTLIDAAVDPAALADASTLLPPAMMRLHESIGIDEPGLLRRAGASHWLATSFAGFGPRPFSIGFGAPPALDVDGDAIGLAAALAAADRFAPPSQRPDDPLADLDYGLSVAPDPYRRHLLSLARHLSIEIAPAAFAAVDRREDGGVASVSCADGAIVTAQLFVDATGPAALVHGGDRLADRDDTRFDTLIVGSPGPPALSLADSRQAGTGAYLMRSSGRDASRTIAVHGDDGEDAALALLAAARVEPFRRVALRLGRASEVWRHNVVAIGDAAASLDPIGGLALHLVARQIALMVETLPAPPAHPAVMREFNRRAALLADSMTDYVALHHGSTRAVSRPTLARTIDLYRRRGHIARWGEDAVPRDLWLQLLAGVVGVRRDAPANAIPAPIRERRARDAALRVAAGVRTAHPYPAWLGAALAAHR